MSVTKEGLELEESEEEKAAKEEKKVSEGGEESMAAGVAAGAHCPEKDSCAASLGAEFYLT